jgi:site-specific recombinase XerC
VATASRWRSRSSVSLEQVHALLGHARIDTTQIGASIRPPQLKRALAFYGDQATRMLSTTSVANGRREDR